MCEAGPVASTRARAGPPSRSPDDYRNVYRIGTAGVLPTTTTSNFTIALLAGTKFPAGSLSSLSSATGSGYYS